MADMVEIEWNNAGFHQILYNQKTRALLVAEGNKIANNANSLQTNGSKGYSATVYRGDYVGGRLLGHVTCADKAGMEDEAIHKTLSRAIGV